MKIVVIGGGTGNFVLLSGLKKIKNGGLVAIVPSTDSGGSTGRLRDEFGYLPVGDLRQCLVALAEDPNEQFLLRELLNYRYEKGPDGLKGHNFGNLFLTALIDILGDEIKGIEATEKLLNIEGKVYPVTTDKSNLIATYENGFAAEGEALIDEPQYPHDGRLKIKSLSIKPKAKAHKDVLKSIKDAGLLMIGPGDLYTSLLANIVVGGVSNAIKKSKAKIVYTVNLMTKFGQTYGFTAADHVSEIEKYIGRKVDNILINNAELPKEIIKKYEQKNDSPVIDDLGDDSRVIRTDLLASEEIMTPKGDILHRSLIRHDGQKIASVVKNL